MQTPDDGRWNSLSAELDRVLDLPESERAAWLAQLESENPALANEIRVLLATAAQRDFGDFLAGSATFEPRTAETQALIGRHVGPYVIDSEVGRGGMGSVWRAVRADGRYEGFVAVKLVHASWLGREGEERFQREGKLLARLDHPHIARLIDAGVLDDNQPYLVLEFVEGVPIDRYCDEQRLDVPARVELMLSVFDAVAHAHSHLVIHRDIKPSNILVTRTGVTKLLDFGIAKPLGGEDDSVALTRSGMSALTPEYAAPEQMLGRPITTATDVYTLGLVLYRLLAGKLPMARESRSTPEYIRALLDQETPHASTVATDPAAGRALEGDLDNILGKALKKPPAERYPSVGAFADDLRRCLNHQPVLARPDTVTYRVTKFVRRHRGGVTTALLMLIALIVATVVSWSQMLEARHQRDRAEIELQRAEAFNDLVSIVLSESGEEGGNITAGELLKRGEALVRTEFAATPVLRAQLMFALAELDLQAGLYDEEHQLSTDALDQAMKTGDTNLIALTGCALVESDSWNGSLKGVRERAARYTAMLTTDRSSDAARIQCLQSQSIIERNLGDGDRALHFAEQADTLAQRFPSATPWGKLVSKLTLADAERSAGRFTKADDAYQQIAAGLDGLKIENTSMAMALYNNWGLALLNLGQPARAATLFKRTLDAQSKGAPIANSRVTYVSALLPLGRAQEARELLEPMYAAALTSKNRTSAIKVRLSLAAVYRELGLFGQSDQMLRDDEKEMTALFPPGHEALGALHINKSLLAQSRQDYSGALKEIDAALAIFSANPSLAYRVAIARISRAEILLALNRTVEARADAEQAMTALEKIVGPGVNSLWVGRTWLVVAQIEGKEGHVTAAQAAARKAEEHLQATVGAQHKLTIAAHDLAGMRSKAQT